MRFRILAAAFLLAGCATASPSPSPRVEVTPSPSPTVQPSPTAVPLDQVMLASRFTVLVAGADTDRSRRAEGIVDVNTDALMVVSVSADKSRIAVMSLPRDTVDLPMADGSIYHDKVNGIAQKLGIETLRSAMATLLGVPIDRYIQVDMDDFTWLVDAVDGIDVEVKTPISDAGVDLFLDPGPAHLDGARALSFSRTRADSDYGRAARQQQVIVALARKWLDPGLGAMLQAARLLGSLETDISPREVPTLLEIGRRSASAEVTGVVLEPPRFSLFEGFEQNSPRGWVMIPNVAEIQAYARSVTSD